MYFCTVCCCGTEYGVGLLPKISVIVFYVMGLAWLGNVFNRGGNSAIMSRELGTGKRQFLYD